MVELSSVVVVVSQSSSSHTGSASVLDVVVAWHSPPWLRSLPGGHDFWVVEVVEEDEVEEDDVVVEDEVVVELEVVELELVVELDVVVA